MAWLFEGAFHQHMLYDLICPKRFELKQRYGRPQEYRTVGQVNGLVLHKCIETIHQDGFGVSCSEPYFRGLYESAIALEQANTDEPPIRWRDKDPSEEQLAEDAGKILFNYAQKPFNRECEVLLSEAEWKCDIGEYPWEGRIDQVRKHNGQVILIDFKSGNNKPEPYSLRMGLQFSIYFYALRYGFFNGEPVDLMADKVVHYQLHDHLPYKRKTNGVPAGTERGPAWYETERTEAEMPLIVDEVKRNCSDVRRGVFSRRPYPQICRGCQVKEACLYDWEHGGLDDKVIRKLRQALEEEDLAA